MNQTSYAERLAVASRAGELVPVGQIPQLRRYSADTRIRWCRTGRIPAVLIGSRWHSTSAIVADAIASEYEKTPPD